MEIRNKHTLLFLIGLFGLALIYRLPELDHPFWVDEFSSAFQAQLVERYGLGVFQQQDYYFEYHNILTHFLIASSFKLLGLTEVAARMPTVIVGSLVPVVIFLLAKKIDKPITAIVAGLLAALSYYQIVWSQQARGYMLQQVLLLSGVLIYLKIIETKKPNVWLVGGLFTVLILGLLTHLTFIIPIFALAVHYLYLNKSRLQLITRSPLTWIFITVLIAIILITDSITHLARFGQQFLSTGLVNNVWYYHAFLWREQTLITFLGAIGLTLLFLEKPKTNSLLLLILVGYLFFFALLFPPYVTRYLLPIFPLLLLGMAVCIRELAEILTQNIKLSINKNWLVNSFSLGIVGFVIFNGGAFVNFPERFYSVNHFMREIALLDYDRVYAPIQAAAQSDDRVAVIDTWLDRARWYMGFDFPNVHVYRWSDNDGTTNGLTRTTPHEFTPSGLKIIPRTGNPPVHLISEVSDLKAIMNEFPRGFIWIDDTSMPEEVRKYAEEHFQEIVYVDHYPLDDNPASIWPGTLYSWGEHNE